MSNLLVQNIKHTNNTSAQTIDSSGRTTAVLNNDTTYRSDSGAVTQNLVQGLNKFWNNIDADESSISSRDSFNQSSITDGGTGDYVFVFTNNMANNDYSHTTGADSASGHLSMIYGEGEMNTGQTRTYIIEVYTDNTATDANVVVNTIAGDLA